MFPVLEILVAVLLGLSYPAVSQGPSAPSDWVGVVGMQLLGLALARIAAALVMRHWVGGRRRAAAATHAPAFLFVRLAGLGLFGLQIWVFGWPQVVAALGLEGWILVDEILILVPYLLHLAMTWWMSFRVERLFRFREWTAGGYVLFQARQRLLPLAPLLVLIVINDGIDLLAGRVTWVHRLRLWMEHLAPIQWAFVIVVFVLVMVFAPILFRVMWGMRPLPDGPLRRRLERFADRVGFRARDILLWPTRGNVLNAAIIGLTARFRYVMLTDGLVQSLTEDEIEAVFAHEVGHAKHRHMLLFLLFAIAFLFVSHLLFLSLPEVSFLGNPVLEVMAILIVSVVVWWGVIFGWISRRLEQQADVYGALATARAHGDAQESAFIEALENLAEESGQIRHLPGLRHFTLSDRIDFLRRFLVDPAVRHRYERSIRRLIVTLLVLFGIVIVAAASTLPEQWRLGRVAIAFEEKDPRQALRLSARLAPGNVRVRSGMHALGLLARTVTKEDEALELAGEMRNLLDTHPDFEVARLGVGWLLVRAAEATEAPERIALHVESAAPLLRGALATDGDVPDDFRAEAAMLLSRAVLRDADAAVLAGDRESVWLRRILRAREWLAVAEKHEQDPQHDYDQQGLHGEILSREGRLDEAVAWFGRAAKARDEKRTPDVEAHERRVALNRLQRAPLDAVGALALADWARGRAGDGAGRIRLRLMTADALIRAAALDARSAPGRLEEAGPIYRSLTERADAPDDIRRAAWLGLARLFRVRLALGLAASESARATLAERIREAEEKARPTP